jgi:hypothetical protein
LNCWAPIVTLEREAYDTFDTGFAALVFTFRRKSCRIASNAVRLLLLSKIEALSERAPKTQLPGSIPRNRLPVEPFITSISPHVFYVAGAPDLFILKVSLTDHRTS